VPVNILVDNAGILELIAEVVELGPEAQRDAESGPVNPLRDQRESNRTALPDRGQSAAYVDGALDCHDHAMPFPAARAKAT